MSHRRRQDEESTEDKVTADLRTELFEVPCIGCRAQILGFPAALARPDGEAVPDRGAHPGRNHRRSHPRVGDDTDEIGLPGVAIEGCCLDRSEEHRAVLRWIPIGAAGNPNDSERGQVLSGQPDRFPDPEIERRGQTRADDDLRRALGDVALSHHERRQDCALPPVPHEGPGRSGAGRGSTVGQLQGDRERQVGHGLGDAGNVGHLRHQRGRDSPV